MPAITFGSEQFTQLPLECIVTQHAAINPEQTISKTSGTEFIIEKSSGDWVYIYPKDSDEPPSWEVMREKPYFNSFIIQEQSEYYFIAFYSVSEQDFFKIRKGWSGEYSGHEEDFYFELFAPAGTGSQIAYGWCQPTTLTVSKFPFRDSPWPAKNYKEVKL